MRRYYENISHALPERDAEVRKLATEILAVIEGSEASTPIIMESIDLARKCVHRSIETAIFRGVFGEETANAIAQEDVIFGPPRAALPTAPLKARRKRARRRTAATGFDDTL